MLPLLLAASRKLFYGADVRCWLGGYVEESYVHQKYGCWNVNVYIYLSLSLFSLSCMSRPHHNYNLLLCWSNPHFNKVPILKIFWLKFNFIDGKNAISCNILTILLSWHLMQSSASHGIWQTEVTLYSHLYITHDILKKHE